MHWLNINLTTLRSPAYLGSTPVERATWLQLLAYCADQENGGRIAGAARWKDRQWRLICGVSAREVRAASRLVAVEGEDVRVVFYPLEQEAEMRARREKGRDAANRRWHGEGEEKDEGGSRKDEVRNGSGDGSPIAVGIGCGNAKRNGMESNRNGNGNGHATHATPIVDVCNLPPANGARAPEVCVPAGVSASSGLVAPVGLSMVSETHAASACSSREAVEHGSRLVPPCPEQWCLKWWEDCERRGWVDRDGIPVRRWQPALSSYWRGVQEMERRVGASASANGTSFSASGNVAGNGNGNGANGPGTHGRAPAQAGRAMSAFEIKTRLEAIDGELGRIRSRAKDGRSADGLRIIKLYTPEEEARRGQLLKAKEVLQGKLTEV
jgi:hypothetical protein